MCFCYIVSIINSSNVQLVANHRISKPRQVSRQGLVALLGPALLLPGLKASGTPPDVAAPSDEALRRAGRGGSRAHVEVEDGLAGGLRRTGVVVDDVADLLLLAVDVSLDVPVVAIKRRLSPIRKRS